MEENKSKNLSKASVNFSLTFFIYHIFQEAR